MYALYLAYCKLPVISEGDCTVTVATQLLEFFKMIVPKGAKAKIQHCTTIDKVTIVLLEYQPPQRVDTQGQPPQRVVVVPTASHVST